MAVDIANLRRLIALVGGRLAEMEAIVGPFDHKDYQGWRRRHDTVFDSVKSFLSAAEGASFGLTSSHEHTVRLAGIRSTSTSGAEQALRNWCATAAKKLEREGEA